ncbi:unnamed protein product, partial [Polarella glacialis]
VALVHTFLAQLRWFRTAVTNVGCVTWAELFIDFMASVQYDSNIFPLTDSMSQLMRTFSKLVSFILGPALKLRRLQVGRAFRYLRLFGRGNASGIRARHNSHAVDHAVARMVQYHCTVDAIRGPALSKHPFVTWFISPPLCPLPSLSSLLSYVAMSGVQ